MTSYLSFRPQDWGCTTQLFFDNASTLLGVLAAVFNMTAFGVPLDVINTVRWVVERADSIVISSFFDR